MTSTRPLRLLAASATCALIAACNGPLDFDLRDLGNGFDTSRSVENLAPRPQPDDRGVISYPNYQVVVAQNGDTPRIIADRIGLDADTLAAFNGIDIDADLRRDEVLALPGRVAEPSPATGATTTGPITPTQVDVTSLAGAAIDRAGDTTTTALPPATTATTTIVGAEPIRHQIGRGETIFSVARLYNVPPRTIAEWNGLGPELNVREGQFLIVPNNAATAAAAATAPEPVVAPGEGSITPVPPSAADPLPDEPEIITAETPVPEEIAAEVPDLGSEQTASTTSAQMILPAQGSIIRAFAPGRNDGIDIGADAGATVSAAAAGTVAAVTTDTAGVQIVVIRHPDNLLTVYTHLENLTIARGDAVQQGQPIGSVRAGTPSFLHFEVRRGTDAEDPTQFLP